MTSNSKRQAILGGGAAIVVVALVALVAFATTRSSTDSSASAPDGSSSTSIASDEPTSPTGDPTNPSTDPSTDPGASTPDPGVAPTTVAPPEIPLTVTVSSTANLVDGQAVKIHVTPKAGSDIYGVEVFVCAANMTFTLDADIRPSLTGKCITKRLSPMSLDYLNQAIPAPYQSLDVSFPVGVGSDQYTTQRGQGVTITCGPGHPCQLVLKLQFPNGYGFRAYPLTFG